MKRKRFATDQIIKILKEAELGIKISELYRKCGIAEQEESGGRKRDVLKLVNNFCTRAGPTPALPFPLNATTQSMDFQPRN